MLLAKGTILRKVQKETKNGSILHDLVLFDEKHSQETIKVTGTDELLGAFQKGDIVELSVNASEFKGNVQYFANEVLDNELAS